MSEAKETLHRLQSALFHLQRGLHPFVQQHLSAKHGANWRHYASKANGSDPRGDLDAYALLKTIQDNWSDVFSARLPRNTRSFIFAASDARNAWAHPPLTGIPSDDALRYLDAIHQLLLAVRSSEAAAVKALHLEQVRVAAGMTESTVATSTVKSAPASQESLGFDTPEHVGVGQLRPWREIAAPHTDVSASRFEEADFAVDLTQVDLNRARGDYQNPRDFFAKTFLTEGLKRVLRLALERLTGRGGEPVIGLQTSFGGGKTHTMLALWHLANAEEPRALTGIPELLDTLGIEALPSIKTFVFVGTGKGPNEPMNRPDEPTLRTPWGYLAWRLAGDAGLELVRESENARTNPGSEALMGVLAKAGPSLILLDEVVAYGRQLEGSAFEAFLSFIQSLTEAVKASPGALLVGSLPESIQEAGGAAGQQVLVRLQSIFGRVQSPWLPAQGMETYEIIRRRLFQDLQPEEAKERDKTVKRFHDLYKQNPSDFPAECREAAYLERMRVCYPVHPELFDMLSSDWATLSQFQRTRGVLRFMANVIYALWRSETNEPLILPGSLPLSDQRLRSSALHPLQPAYAAILDSEIEGDNSLAQRVDASKRRFGEIRAATRAARAIFMATAPHAGVAHAGLTGTQLRLACARPNDPLPTFGDALRELKERANYLYEDGGRYWFATQPTLNRIADEKAKSLSTDEIDAAIIAELREDARSRSGFSRVHAAPDEPTDVEDGRDLTLVILGPATAHTGRTAGPSPATDIATSVLQRCRSSQRIRRNTLFFVAADEVELGKARENIRQRIAWQSILDDEKLTSGLTQAQLSDAKEKLRSFTESTRRSLRAAWSHVLYPLKPDMIATGEAFEIAHLPVTARERASVAAATYDKCRADGVILERLGAETFANRLDPLWPEDEPHLPVKCIAEWFASYVYLPKLRDAVVLAEATRLALSSLGAPYGYAEAYDDATGRYRGLSLDKAVPVDIGSDAVLVRRAVAERQIEAERPVHPPEPGGREPMAPSGSGDGVPGTGSAVQPPPGPPQKRTMRRFVGVIDLDPQRPIPTMQKVVENIIAELQRTRGTSIKLTLEIEAEATSGFDESDASVVRDNTKTLKFREGPTGFFEE